MHAAGMFVSESKFRSAPADFIPHIYSRNEEALASLITKPAVEAALLKRLAKKAAFYGQELDANGNPKTTLDQAEKDNLKIDVEEVVALYRDYIIPLTKVVEVGDRIPGFPDLSDSLLTLPHEITGGVPFNPTGWPFTGRNRQTES